VEAWPLAGSGSLAHVWVVSGMRKFRPN
jgi:hypothetical protein